MGLVLVADKAGMGASCRVRPGLKRGGLHLAHFKTTRISLGSPALWRISRWLATRGRLLTVRAVPPAEKKNIFIIF